MRLTMTATISLNSIERLAFVNETPCLFCEVKSMQYLCFLPYSFKTLYLIKHRATVEAGIA
jgi:hypothetical protein